ncbi:MAG: transglutaminase family protein [Dehalococcoidia bacterium]
MKRAVYSVRHHYRYTYTGPVSNLRQRLVMVPPDSHDGQRLLDFDLDVRGTRGGAETRWEQDDFGNRLCQVTASAVERAVDFEVRYRVERQATAHPFPKKSALKEYLRPTALTAPDDRLREAARRIGEEATCGPCRAEAANQWAAGAITYQPGATGVQTPAAMALHTGRGVCQDYAHILLTVLRLLGLPARYVSGHLLGEGVPHAWVEVFLADEKGGGGEVVAYDPTHRRVAGMNYIYVAGGRDFADVSPTSGYFSGGAAGKLSSSKRADILAVEPAGATAK